MRKIPEFKVEIKKESPPIRRGAPGGIRRGQDDGMRALFKKNLPEFHWVPVETWALNAGVPDVEFCAPNGVSGWVEFKCYGKKGQIPALKPSQIGWIDRRIRVKGRVFIGVKKGENLFLAPGERARDFLDALMGPLSWAEIREHLRTR